VADILEQRANIKVCRKSGKMVVETYEILQSAFGEETLSHTRTFQWFAPLLQVPEFCQI
jgi:hypothetical protein